ncbi:MAG: tetratricopeptide repeat protein [Planctomycetes bacterium]|nr:tetratricopeptide repeat protein [Planctomycetota bacterium]
MNDEREAKEMAGLDSTCRALIEAGRWDELMMHLNERINHDRNNVLLWCNRGRLWLRRHAYQMALRDFEEALRLDSHCVRAYLGCGDVHLELGHLGDALAAYNEAISLAPSHAPGYWSRGKVYLEENRTTDAISEFSRAVDLAPGWALPYFWRAFARQDVGDFHGALSDYDAFLRQEHEHSGLMAEAYGARGFIYKTLGLSQQSIAEYNKELQLNSRSAIAYLGRGRALELAGEHQQAAEDFRRALDIDPCILDEESEQS